MKKTLYKLDSKSKIRVWSIWTEDGILIQEAGILDGKLVQHSKQCKSKNVGKSNETSPEEQALLELESECKGKLTEGYFETIEEAKNEIVILPMLAKSYDDEKHKIDWIKDKVYIQPKLDGQRCLAFIKNNVVKLISRDGKVIENMDHIKLSLSFIMEDCILDGELYSMELGTFQENMKAIKKYRSGITEKIKYNVYDCITEENFTKRFNKAQKLIEGIQNTEIVTTMSILNDKEINLFHNSYISNGYEGSIIRWGNSEYKINGRSSNLLKYKNFQDLDAEIIDILPNDANSLHGTPLLKYSVNKLSGVSSSIFKAGVKMSHEDRVDLLANKHLYIGKLANIRFFEWTDDGNPRFPVMIGIHIDR
jgi:DNA ligase-1